LKRLLRAAGHRFGAAALFGESIFQRSHDRQYAHCLWQRRSGL